MNRQNVEKLRDFLRDEVPDERFDMDDFLVWDGGENRYQMPIGKAINVCGTAACIAGWAQVLFEPARSQHDELARTALGLTHDQADALFLPPFRASLTRTEAVYTLTRLLETGEVRWSAPELPQDGSAPPSSADQ